MRFELMRGDDSCFLFRTHNGNLDMFCAFDKNIINNPDVYELSDDEFRTFFLLFAYCCDRGPEFDLRTAAFATRVPVGMLLNVCKKMKCIEEVNEG